MSVNIPAAEYPPSKSLSLKLNSLFKEWGAATFQHGGYPKLEMKALADAGLLSFMLTRNKVGLGDQRSEKLLDLLRIIGEGNLSVGRIYEGHVNALQLIALYGTESQQRKWFEDARSGHVFGVWNTQMANGVKFNEESDARIRLAGSKTFCSGSVNVTRPIITGELYSQDGTAHGWQMAIVPLDRHEPEVDRSFWATTGMRNSVSDKIDFTGIHLDRTDLLGRPNDYNRQPHLSGGAVRFAAVQLGGAEAVLNETRAYLQRLGRTGDPHQRSRVAKMVIAVQSGKLWLGRAGRTLDTTNDTNEIINMANQTRLAITAYCQECLGLSDQCVGARGMLPPEPLARLHADLRVYLRQPAPDATLDAVGQYFLDEI